MLKKISASIAIAVFMLGAAFGQTPGPSGAESRLKEAWALKRTSFKQEEDVKRDILVKTVACYRSLLRDFSDAKPACAEACFRIGEILRSLKKADEAEEAFNQVLEYDKKGEFAARALKEIGHLYRRKKEFEKAAAYYQRVMDECPGQRDVCADAFTWTGKIYLKQKENEKARKLLLGFSEKFPEFPDEAIRNIDLAIVSLLKEGKKEEAQKLLQECNDHFEALLGKDKTMDKKIKKALEGMKAPESLKP